MASFAAQLVDMLYGLIGRVTGYGARAEDGNDAEQPSKLSCADAFRTDEVIEIRSRNLAETGGSSAQVNRVDM